MSRTHKDSHKQPRWKRGNHKPDLKRRREPKRIVKTKAKASVRRRAGE